MLRTSIVPTLAAAAVAGTSAFVTGSQIASQASSDLTLPDCAGSGLSAVRTPGVAVAFSDPNACLEPTAALGLLAATISAETFALTEDEDDVVVVDLTTLEEPVYDIGYVEVSVC